MSSSSIRLDQASDYFKSTLTKEIRRAAIRGLQTAAMRGVQIIQTQIVPSRSPQPVDRGVYRAGWKWEPTSDGALIFNDETHAAFIEHGVRAENIKIGFAMIEALAEWAVRKGIVEDVVEGARVAWAIALTMRDRGIFNRNGSGMGILNELVEQHLPKIIGQEVAREIDRI